jgi:DNA-binding GntR family transcriptional regulator
MMRIRADLRRWIQYGTIAPGDLLDEHALAARLGVRRTPVREAILLLAGEGLVVLHPDGGFRAAPMTGEEGRDLLRLLGELESRAVFRAAPYRAVGLARLEELDAASLTTETAAERLAMDRRWHHHLLPAHRIGRLCRREIDRLEVRAERYQLALLADGESGRYLVDPVLEHRAIVDDLLDDRLTRAAARLEAHWLGTAAAVASRWPPSGSGALGTGPARA